MTIVAQRKDMGNFASWNQRSYNGPRRPSEKTFVFGIHPVTEALESGKNLDSIVVQEIFS